MNESEPAISAPKPKAYQPKDAGATRRKYRSPLSAFAGTFTETVKLVSAFAEYMKVEEGKVEF